MVCALRVAFILVSLSFPAGVVSAQDLAEYGSAAAHSSVAAQGSRQQVPASGQQNSGAHLYARSGPPPEETNRKEFEENAGPNAGKVLFRSVPTGADVFLNDLLVGRTPLLMFVAPGKYRVYMRGSREDSGRKEIGVLPKEAQTLTINLGQKYPATVSVR